MKTKSQKQEIMWSDLVEGQTTIGSGNLWFQKGDVNTDNWKFELKTTEKKYYSLHIKDLKFCVKSAYAAYKNPAFVIQFNNKVDNSNIVIFPLSDCEEDFNLDNSKVFEMKKKQIKLNHEDLIDDISILIADKRKYLIMFDYFFLENVMKVN